MTDLLYSWRDAHFPKIPSLFPMRHSPSNKHPGIRLCGGTRHSHDLLEAAQELCSGEGKRRARDMTPRSSAGSPQNRFPPGRYQRLTWHSVPHQTSASASMDNLMD